MIMDFRKKLRIRLYVALSYIVLGIAMFVIFNIIKTGTPFLSSWGFALFVIGVARTRNYFIITKSEQNIKRQEIAESDERNIYVANKAKSFSFSCYVLIACLSVIILQLFNKTELAYLISISVCVLLVLYWVSYFVIRKKS